MDSNDLTPREFAEYLAKGVLLFPFRLPFRIIAKRFRGHTRPRQLMQQVLTLDPTRRDARVTAARLRRRMRRHHGLPTVAAQELERVLRRRGRTLEDAVAIVDKDTGLIKWWKPAKEDAKAGEEQ